MRISLYQHNRLRIDNWIRGDTSRDQTIAVDRGTVRECHLHQPMNTAYFEGRLEFKEYWLLHEYLSTSVA